MALPVRYKLIGLLTLGSMINYADRVNISVAAPVMMPALGWNERQFGLIFSAFLAGYALLQFPGGIIADRWNACRVLVVACIGFSIFTALTPLTFLRRTAAVYPDKVAVVHGATRFTYRELYDLSLIHI